MYVFILLSQTTLGIEHSKNIKILHHVLKYL